MYDAHCHIDTSAFDPDRDALLARAREVGVRGFAVAGFSPDGWNRQRALCEGNEDAIWFPGIHPHVAARYSRDELRAALCALSACARVAVGETGLDATRWVPKDSLPAQEDAFRAQLALARERNLPVVLHVVRAHGRALEILTADGVPGAGGMLHSYSGPADLVGPYEALGLYLSFSGAITHHGARRWADAARATSPERLLVETDCPDQKPAGVPGDRCLPEHLSLVLERLAEVRPEGLCELSRQTERNARLLFGQGGAP